MRCLLALVLDEDVRADLAQIQDRLARSVDGIRWVASANLHLTLQFLGEWDEQDLEGLAELLDELPQRKPLQLELGELGLLGSKQRPRVVHMGLGGEVGRLQDLVAEIGETVELALGLPREKRAWFPHITLGRVKRLHPGPTEQLKAAFLECGHEAGRPLSSVTSFSLLISQLKPSGALYRRWREFGFVAEPDVADE